MPSVVFQPMFRLSDMAVLGAEALSRFQCAPPRTPDLWFQEAEEVGLRTELELKAIVAAISRYKSMWDRDAFLLALNISPQTIVDGGLAESTVPFPPESVVFEISEHQLLDHEKFRQALAPLRQRGVKTAVNAHGYASMRHIVDIGPDFIKLGVSLVQNIDKDRTRCALARALIEFGQETECRIVAEGVENDSQLRVLKDLGVHAVQGYLLSRPISLEEMLRLVR
jgi:EAL domain-containing protein (putative c-di-GMP-specific phosphodiesterase class I)